MHRQEVGVLIDYMGAQDLARPQPRLPCGERREGRVGEWCVGRGAARKGVQPPAAAARPPTPPLHPHRHDALLRPSLHPLHPQVRAEDKPGALLWLLQEVLPPGQATIVFTSTRHHVEFLQVGSSAPPLLLFCVCLCVCFCLPSPPGPFGWQAQGVLEWLWPSLPTRPALSA